MSCKGLVLVLLFFCLLPLARADFVSLSSAYDYADGVFQNTGSNYYAFQTRWNISSLPSGQVIDEALLCYYNFGKDGTADLDANVSWLDNQTWVEQAGGYSGKYANQKVPDSYLTSWSGAALPTVSVYRCVAITDYLQTEHTASNTFVSVRISDPDRPITTLGYIESGANIYWSAPSNWLSFYSRQGTTKPYLNITYHSGAAAPAPQLEFFLYANQSLLGSIKEWQQFYLVVQHSLDNGSLLSDSFCTCNVTNGTYLYADTLDYNASLSAYRNHYLYSYRNHCASCLTVSASCDNPNSDYDLSGSKSFAINNLAPMPMISHLITADRAYLLDDGYEVNYSAGIYVVNATPYNTGYYIDNDIGFVRWQLRNSSQLIKSETGSSYSDFSFNSVLVVRNGTYNVSVYINDTAKASGYQSALFWTRDYSLPVCSGLSPVTLYNGTTYSWNVSCSDDYFWSFNLSCGNGFGYARAGIANTSYVFINSSLISSGADFVCDYEYCDGHTAMLLEPLDIRPVAKEGVINVEGISLNVMEAVADVRLEKKEDRYSFCYAFADQKQAYATLPVPDGCFAAPNSKWKGHLVCPAQRVWIDFENKDVGVSVAEGEVLLDLANVKDRGNVCFDSIGKWNCVSGEQAFTVLIPERNSTSMFQVGWCPETEPGALIIGIVVFFFLGILVLGIAKGIPIFAYAAGLGLIVASFTLIGCSAFIGLCFMVVGLVSILVGTQV